MELPLFFLFLALLFVVIIFFYLPLKNKMLEATKKIESLSQDGQNSLKKIERERSLNKELKEKFKEIERKLQKKDLKKTVVKSKTPESHPLINNELEKELAELRRQDEHSKEQILALIEQLKERNQALLELRVEASSKDKKNKQEQENNLKKLNQEQGKLKERSIEQKKKNNKSLLELKIKIKNYETKVETETKKLKKKLKDYQHFYSMSISQKKLLEEKIENWEKALAVLSSWILKKDKQNTNMGEFVAEALEKTGYGSLIEDEFNFKTQERKKPMVIIQPLENVELKDA